jgi:uncharacterized protein (UPF0332 family)
MSLTEEERKAITSYRITKSKETLAEAKGIATLNFWNAVVNRLYYSCYYITGALLIANNFTAQTHSGVIHLLGLHFIKTNRISKAAGKLYSKLYELRQSGDYDDLFYLDEEDVKPLIDQAEKYIDELEKMIDRT